MDIETPISGEEVIATLNFHCNSPNIANNLHLQNKFRLFQNSCSTHKDDNLRITNQNHINEVSQTRKRVEEKPSGQTLLKNMTKTNHINIGDPKTNNSHDSKNLKNKEKIDETINEPI